LEISVKNWRKEESLSLKLPMINTETWIALFLLFTSIAYLIAYVLYTDQTIKLNPQFTYVGVFFVVAGIFFVLYAGLNYYNVAHGKGATHIDYLDQNTAQGRYSSQPAQSVQPVQSATIVRPVSVAQPTPPVTIVQTAQPVSVIQPAPPIGPVGPPVGSFNSANATNPGIVMKFGLNQ
jgi:hypothetical protein